MAASSTADPSRLDPWTVGALAVVAYCVGNVVHEGLGHGGACVLVGGKPQELNAIFFECSIEGLPGAARRWLAAGGSIANLLVAIPVWIALRRLPRGAGHGRAFAWLLLAVNLLTAFGYLLFSGLGNIGDWAVVVRGLEPALVFRGALALAGAGLYFLVAPRLLMPWLEPFLGPGVEQRQARARTLSLLPYFVGGLTFVAAGLLNPHGLQLVLISAMAASFGGMSLLFWYPTLYARRPAAAPGDVPLGVPRSRGWLLAAAITLVVFVGLLGPGVRFGGP